MNMENKSPKLSLQLPTLHLNGTSQDSLLEDLSAAGQAVREAMERLAVCYPNGRDYYVQEAGSLARAEAQHAYRMERLRDVLAELNDLAEGVASTPNPRSRR
jgi:hypothetical protein